jgi:TonB family protein
MRAAFAKAIAVIMFLAICCRPTEAQQPRPDANDDLEVVTFQDLEYPPTARVARIEGTVVVRVNVDDQGKVTDAVVLSGSRRLSTLAVANVKTWTFRPNATKSGVVVYNFTILPGVCGVRAGSLFVLRGNVGNVVTCPVVPMP